MKRYYVITAAVSALVLLAFSFLYSVWDAEPADSVLKVGFLYENDESTPYTFNFVLAEDAVEKQFGQRVEVYTISNVLETETAEALHGLIRQGCSLIFAATYSSQVEDAARENPDVQFCQAAGDGIRSDGDPANYHTFGGDAHQGWYVCGVAAGMKLLQMAEEDALPASGALVGFVGTQSTQESETESAAFLQGVRSVLPEAEMRVAYTNVWNSFSREKSCAADLIAEGCVIIAQDTPTVGPAVACEEAAALGQVYHIGWNRSMIDIAPSASLVSARVNWTPYVTDAVEARLSRRAIEKKVSGSVRGSDTRGGFTQGWVEMLELNQYIAAPGTAERMSRAIDGLRKGTLTVGQ